MKKVLITGITGQLGSYLSEKFLDMGYEVHGIIRKSSSFNTGKIDHIFDKLNLYYGDLTDSLSIDDTINKVKPDYLVNAGAQSVSSDSLVPILSSQKISYRTLESLWDNQVKKNSNKLRVENVDNIEVEVIDLSEKTQLKALGYTNGMGSWFKIKQISRHKYKGHIVEMSQKFGSIKVTPNHSILDTNQKVRLPEDNPWLLNVRKLNYVTNKKINSIKLSIKGNYNKDDEYFWVDESGEISKLKRNLNEDELISYLIFLGAFVNEGHTTFNKENGNYIVSISEESKECLEDIESHLNKFFTGVKSHITHKKEGFDNVYELHIKSKVLYKHLRENCGINSHTKKIPDFIFQLDKSKIQYIFDKMIEGNGCYREDDVYRYTTSSYKLACQFSMLNTLLGYDYTVNEEYNDVDGKSWHFRRCHFYQYNQGEDGKKIKYVEYDDYVYDISVEEVQNFAVGVGNIVVHNSHVHVSFDIPMYTSQVDALGTLSVLEAVRKHAPDCKVVQMSTSELFGKVAEIPQNENTTMNCQSPYSVAKLYAYQMTKLYRSSYDMFVCNIICFNMESERRGGTFVTRKITLALSRINKSLKNGEDFEILKLGNLNAKRDWGYCPDYADGIIKLLHQDKPDDFILSTGETHSIREFIQEAIQYTDIDLEWFGEDDTEYAIDKKTGKQIIGIDPKYYRPAEVDLLIGDASKAKKELNWEPTVKFKELVKIMIENDMNNIK